MNIYSYEFYEMMGFLFIQLFAPVILCALIYLCMLGGRSSSLPLCDCNVLNLIKLNYDLFIFALNGYLGELKVGGK